MCIDVRSERMRRQLESLSSDLETVGFAGFFGVPFELVPLGASHGPAQCPVLLQPAVKVQEAVHECHGDHHKQMIQQRWITRTTRRIWKAFQGSAASCFTCVESIGVGYLAKLISGRMALSMNPKSARYDGVAEDLHDKLSPVWHATCEHTKQQQVATAESILKNLGIGKNLAKIVVLCGHGSATRNNPYRAGLDCGACGGHTGEANARVVANLLNDPEVRSGLAKKGSSIPCDTWFVAALHNTTTDEIELFDSEAVPAHLDLELSLVRQWTEDAAELNRSERAPTLNQSVPDRLITNSLDWATTRPEWGLAGNAAFVVGSRTLTKGLKLEGRVFLHNYNHEQDVDHKTLELIMTAPMIVTNWINLQYYASTVDNHRYGAGNKVLHNVVGQFGTYEGNGGDLRTGLPWQSVHDGEQFRHEPLRLQVVIQAPLSAIDGILAKHPHVYELVTNGWLTLLAVEGSRTYVYAGSGVWEDSVLA